MEISGIMNGDTDMKKPIMFLCPMDCELSAILSALENPKKENIGCYEYYSGTLCGTPAVAVKTQIGSVNCAAALNIGIMKFSPSYVILQGTAGAHSKDLHRGDIVIAKSIVPIAAYVSSERKKGEGISPDNWFFCGALELKKNELSGRSELLCDSGLIDTAAALPYTAGKKVIGVIGSGDVWNKELDMIEYLNRRFGTLCEEMEGFAAAQICAQYNIPFADIRVISNNEWYPDETFLSESAALCQQFCIELAKKL
ncbi:MAG: 5'-methylthioadenosine/S-adenosylhomocysteine nucleosidase [Clostridiales bacterium]|nr:5'-methylthioadenosine/S-adenosylhomocysteine nucleosidase [Candidatus Equinaster intestinalis]